MCGALPLKGYGMSEQGARPVATAGVMTAAAVIYALAAICLPLPTMMMGMLWPVFIALVTVREGFRWGLLVSIAALLLTLPLATPAMGAFFVLSFAPTGLAIGGLFRRKADTLRALTGGVLASLGGKTLSPQSGYAARPHGRRTRVSRRQGGCRVDDVPPLRIESVCR